MQRVFILAAALAFTVTFTGDAFAQAKKSKASCSMEACMSACAQRGGQPRLCPDYCTKRLAERKC